MICVLCDEVWWDAQAISRLCRRDTRYVMMCRALMI